MHADARGCTRMHADARGCTRMQGGRCHSERAKPPTCHSERAERVEESLPGSRSPDERERPRATHYPREILRLAPLAQDDNRGDLRSLRMTAGDLGSLRMTTDNAHPRPSALTLFWRLARRTIFRRARRDHSGTAPTKRGTRIRRKTRIEPEGSPRFRSASICLIRSFYRRCVLSERVGHQSIPARTRTELSPRPCGASA